MKTETVGSPAGIAGRLVAGLAAAALLAGAGAAWSQEAADTEERLRAAQERLEAAAHEIAELSARMAPMAGELRSRMNFLADRPLLGISIGRAGSGPVEGVEVQGVTPGGPAERAGIAAGDVLTRFGDAPLAAGSGAEASRLLLELLEEREPGDEVAVELSREGERREVTVELEEGGPQVYAYSYGFDGVPAAPLPPAPPSVHFWSDAQRHWGDVELVELTPGLGRYFGTDEGLLVVRKPSADTLALEEGDVIKRIGGREPQSVSQAIRILRSYDAGETLELEILRERETRTLSVEIPETRDRLRRRTGRSPSTAPRPDRMTAT